MDRRTFLLLTGTVSGGLLRPPATALDRLRPPGRRGTGRLRFELDEHRHWSLWYDDDGAPVPLIRDAELVAWVGDRPLTLADLEDSTVGTRRPPAGNAVVVRGRAAGVWIEAEFLAAPGAATPQAAVTLTVYPDQYLPTVKGARFFRAPEAAVLPGAGPLVALVNGYGSREPCRVVAVGTPPARDLASHGALGLTRAAAGLAIAFDADGPGEAKVALSADGLEAVSDWSPPRPLRPAGDTCRMRLCYAPQGDGLEALRAVFVSPSPLDQERLAQAVAPAGWCSRYAFADPPTEDAVVANAEFCAAHFDRRFFRYIRLDGGYEKTAGDWETNDRFPHGHRWLTDRIHALGFKAGLWLAPLTVAEGSGLPAAHPEWLVANAEGPVAWDARAAWGGKIYALDGAHPKAQAWLFDLARRAVRDWGYDFLEIDGLAHATGGAHYGGLTHAEAYRAGLGAVRDGLGTEAFLLASGAPLQHAVGLVNGMRIGPDVSPSWGGVAAGARAAGLRGFYQRSAWLNDPDCVIARPPLAPGEARVWASVVALGGGLTALSDDLPNLAPERVTLLARLFPVAPVAGRAVGTAALEPEPGPALARGDDRYPIAGPWRFRTGDDARFGTREFDEAAWETITVPQPWTDAGHPGYDGFAWYRTRFTLPAPTRPAGKAGDAPLVHLDLGKIGDVDETFLNGVKLGQTGDFPPAYRGERQTYRRYRVPADALNWGGENVLAVRVYGVGGGGIWSVTREWPPVAWVAEGAPRWWTVALVNWDDDPRELSQPLAALGVAGEHFDAYDVWRDAPLPEPGETLRAALEPRSARVVALRPVAGRPQVIGTTRHVVQGAVDIEDETWDAATRTLRAKSVNLDSRAYAVTIAVPKGLRPTTCRADVACTVRSLASGHVVLAWPAGGDGRDMAWELRFRSAARR